MAMNGVRDALTIDISIVINREGAINMIQGGVVDGIGHAIYSELNFENGAPAHHFQSASLVFYLQNEGMLYPGKSGAIPRSKKVLEEMQENINRGIP
jgi:hypothetical protein